MYYVIYSVIYLNKALLKSGDEYIWNITVFVAAFLTDKESQPTSFFLVYQWLLFGYGNRRVSYCFCVGAWDMSGGGRNVRIGLC